MPDAATERRTVDFLGAGLCALGLSGVTFALIEQPVYGWSSPAIWGTLIGGLATFAAFLVYESRASHPMLRLDLFRRRNFAFGNLETLSTYAGLAILFFFLVIFLQEVAGYSARRGRADDGAVDRDHVPALEPDGRARRPLRAAARSWPPGR